MRLPLRFEFPLTLSLAATVLVACSGPPTQTDAPLTRPVLLLGEVHDNAIQHAQRLSAFQTLLARGARPALALEQLDRERQAAIDALLRGLSPPADEAAALAAADAVIAAGAPAGGAWDWRFYKPFIALALRNGLPIVAANVSRDDTRRVMREGLAATGFDAAVPADVLAAHAGTIEATHCGMVDTALAQRMALAQVARDQFMARVLETHAGRGVVLLAGNGHVRTDVGAPRWLAPATRARSLAVGWLEAGNDGAAERRAYDAVRVTPPQPRPDPCEGMRKSIPARPASAAAR
jgi:uncharacterized iron-regulated protein